MASTTLYHGSQDIIVKPEYGKGRLHNDYGRGFYCTESLELAREWACSDERRDGYANEYRIDMKGLRVLHLSSDEFTTLHWLALLLEHRIVDTRTPVAEEGKRYLHQHFALDVEQYDVIVGYRADDSYFSFARAFLQNEISLEQLSRSLRLGDLGEQVVIKSERAFDRLRFMEAEPVPSAVYYPKRLHRDAEARARYREEARSQGLGGLYMRDVVMQKVEADDARLR